jgi:peptide/nickel transport system substrate-binding protein
MKELSVVTPTELVVALDRDPGALNPLAPSSVATREINELIFEHLFRRDDEMLMRGHLAERWELRQRLSFFFRSAEGAELAAEKLTELREKNDPRWGQWAVRSVELDSDALRVWVLGHEEKVAGEIDKFFAGKGNEAIQKARFAVTQIRLTVKDAARESFELFQREAIEKGQIRHVAYDELNRSAVISAAGEVDLFQRELQLFYEANQNIEPLLEVIGEARFVSELEVRLFLRDGVRWHDGVAFSSDDVVFSFLEVARPGSNSPLKPWFSSVIAVEAVDPREVRVALREPYAPLMESWEALPMLPAHRLSAGGGSDADAGGGSSGGVATPAEWAKFFELPIGTGPYKVAARQPGKSLTLQAHENYFRGPPVQREMRYVVIADREKRAMALRLGQIDVLRPDDLERVVLREDKRFEEIDGVASNQTLVAWNLRREPFVDTRIRLALAHLADVEGILKEVGGPESRLPRGVFYPGLWLCPEEVEIPVYDVEKALALLAEAGWTRDSTEEANSGETTRSRKNKNAVSSAEAAVVRNSNGEALAFTLLVAADNPHHVRLAVRLAGNWRAHGIAVTLALRPWADLIGDSLATRDFDALLLNWELGYRRDQSILWHSTATDVAAGGGNFTGLRNQIVDDLLEQLKVQTEPEKVRALAVQLQELLWSLQPCLFLEESGEVVMLRRDILREMRPMMDGRIGDQEISVPSAGLAASRPWWVKQDASGGQAANRGL